MASGNALGSSDENAKARGAPSAAAPDTTARARLPRGSNSLPQDLIAEIQRQRLLDAVTLEVGENGYATTSVASIIERAGVSRKTFYELFSDKDQCYTSALQAALDEHTHHLAATDDRDGDATGGDAWNALRGLLMAHLTLLNADLIRARAFFVESVSAAALNREAAVLWQGFSNRLGELIEERFKAHRPDAQQCEQAVLAMLVGGLNSLAATSLASQHATDLTCLLPAMLQVVGRSLGVAGLTA